MRGHYKSISTTPATMESDDEFYNRLDTYIRNNPPLNPSKRTSEDSTNQNIAEDGRRVWGFVIYRCTYESDADWDAFLKHMRFEMEQKLSDYNGLDMLDSHRSTVFEDAALFDKASIATIRQHFREWCSTAPQEEQGTGSMISARYTYCIAVDKECLDSVV
jgi:hypothetical protein